MSWPMVSAGAVGEVDQRAYHRSSVRSMRRSPFRSPTRSLSSTTATRWSMSTAGESSLHRSMLR